MKNIEDTSLNYGSNIERFWRDFFRGFTAPVILPSLTSSDSLHLSRQTQEIRLSNSKTSDLTKFLKNNKLSLYTLIQGVMALLLSHYTRETDILFGSTTEKPDFNIVPVRVSVDPDASVLSWLRELQRQWSTLTECEFTPLEQIQQWSEIPLELPLFEMLVILGNYEKLECFEYPLILSVDAESDLLLKIDYKQTKFADDTIARMLGHLETLLTNIINLPEQTLADIPLLTETERHQLLVEWNQTEVDYLQDKCIHLLFEEQVENTPDAIAVVFENQQITYQELNESANQLANYLQKLGVNADKLVGLCLETSLARIVGLLGILKAGGVYLPLDPVYPQERLRFMIEDSQVSILVTQASLAAKLSENSLQVVSLDADWEKIATESTNNLQSCVTGENLAYVIYTSGSTGTPKGVLISHQAIAHHSQNIIEHYQLNSSDGGTSTSGDRILQFASLSFDVSLEQILPTLAVGATLILIDTKLLTLGEFHQKLIDYGLTVVNIPPAYFTQWLLFLTENAFTNVPNQLRLVICGGEALPVESLKIWQNSPLKRIRLINAYGPTETTITAITFTINQENTSIESYTNIPIGRPLPNRKVYILNQQKNLVPIGIAGELHIGGEGLAQGYLNQPKLTEDKFIFDPFDNTFCSLWESFANRGTSLTRLYKTGDLARYLPNGDIEYLGRIDNQVKIRGFRIELGEIEAVLNQHSIVREAKAITREDIPGDQRLVAYIISKSNQNSPLEISHKLREYLKQKLPDYMIPSAFVVLESFPLTTNGKIDYRSLTAPDFSSAAKNYVAPRTPTEEIITNIWSQVLKVAEIGIDDNFFELGGHSLLATQIISRIRQTLNGEIPLRILFEFPTISQLSSQISTTNNLSITAIEPRKQQKNIPLSFAQQRLWFLDQLEPNSTAYNIPYRLQIQGLLNISILEKSISKIIQRHEILHTNFISIDGQPKQVITAKNTFSLPLIDLQSLTEDQQKLEVEKIAKQEAKQPFNLVTDDLFHIKILQLNAESHILLINLHHIIFDGWSFGVLFDELKAIYTAYYEGVNFPLPQLPIQYADFTLWQRQWLSGEVLESQLNYWEKQLGGALPILELPTDRPRPRIKTYAGATKTFILSPELTANIKSLSQKEGMTLFMTLVTAFKVLLCRYSGQEDVIVGTPIAGRNRREIEGLIGFFVNTLALRTNVSHNPIFRELLNQVKQVCLEAYTNQDVPFEQLVEVLQPERNLSHTPIFQVMFVLQNAPLEELELPNLHLTALEPPKQTAKFDLTLSMAEKNGQLIGEWEYNTDLFDSSTIERMIEHFQVLLSGILATPEQNIWQLPLLTERERHQLLVEWNQTELDYPQDKCIHQLFEEQVKRTPDAVAVMFENEQLTYRELNQRANQLAHYLKSLGVGANVLVGLCMERDSIEEVSLTLDIIVGILGILKAGGAYLPLDPRYPTERLLLMLQDGQVPVLLTQKHLSARLPQHQVELICLDTDWLLISQSIESNPVCEIQPKNLAYAIYTSGSTGEPKGVMIQHSSVVNLANGLHQAIYSDHQNFPLRVSLNGSLTFDTSVKQIIQLIYGHSLNIVPEKVRFDGNAMLSYLQQQKIDVLDCTPSHLRLLIAAGLLESDAAPQYVLVGGEPIDESMWTTLAQAQNIKFYNVYGPTECTVDTTLCLIQIANIKPVIGRPIANVKTYILDEYLQPVPINIPGELHIGGAGLARGYVNAKELTQKKFISNPFDQAAESRLYKTGDLARYLPNGEIEYLGRIDNQVKIRGFRIELGEIEAVLNQHPNLKAAKVITREDIPGDKRLVAYIISKSNQNSPSEISHQLREYLKQKLPDYMIPSAFVVLESFPLTTNGKIDCRSLPAPNFADSGSNYVAPRTPTEEIIAHIWSQVLKIETIGIDDNFFELGGHSLLATQVISRIRQSFNLEIPLYLLFEFPTIAQISEQIGITKQTDDVLVAAITPRQQQENLPLSFAQQRLWFLDKLKPNSSAYNIAYRLKILGSLNINILEQSLYEIIQRHEILQTNFVVVNGQPTQVITHNFDFNLPIIDLQSLPDFQRETEAEKIAKQEAEKSLNLAEDTLFRIQLLRLSPEDNLLLINIHHIIFDGWSFRVLFEELKALYTAYCQDLTSPLRQLPIQYADFTLWQRQWLTGEVLESQLNYWKRQLGGTLPVLELPTDRPRPQVQTYAGATKFFIFSKELTASLKSLCQEEGVTLFMTLLTAFKILLCRYSGQKDVIVGTPIAGRNRREIEVLIGFFVNTLALRTDLGEHRSFRELLSRVRRVCLEAYTHQDVPFEQLVEVLQPERNLSHTPIFQVMFALQNALMGELQLPNLTVTALEALVQTAKFDLTLSMSERNGQLIGEWEYNTDLFDGSTIERMIQHFQMLLSGILAAPHQCIWELPLITEKEKHQLLIEWNQTQTDYHQDQCIHQLFEEQVERTPDAVAVVFEQVQLTYRELNKRANQLANYLQTLGVKAEVLVGICTERSLEMIVGILGILKAGGAYVPLDIVYPQERLAFMLSDSQVSILLTQQHLVEKLPEHQATVICLDTDSKAIELENQEKVSNGANPENLAYVMYTSGSTGQPKGVCVLHLGVVRLVKETNYANLSSEEVFLQLAPLAFDASTFEIWGSLLNGGRLVIFPAPIPTLEDLAASIHRYKITTLWLTAGLFHLMVDQRLEDLKPLRQLLAGGDVLSLATVQRVVEALDNCQVINGYGPTENTTFTCYYSMMRGMQFGSSVPIGRPIANTQVYILDQFLQPVPISVTGEIYVGGAGLARGYLNRPELTAERFISHPFNNQAKARLYKTGDLGRYLPNGEIEYLGRIDNQVKIRGFRIELGEIEAVLNQHPNLKAAKVITREDIPGDKRLVAYIISKSNQNSPSEISHQLREYLKQKLPDYMIPSAFVALESFPLTTNGKIDHRALPTVDFINFESKKIYNHPII
ncbi:non-ribosomal peptide synthetase [Anabaena cylindrica]|uniref:Amino acid adenylation domain protein n=1 Tax=Anabaena cylindrica (strain ATCC 27899 / PCC 7122) TaxID=272123 RepID=K9ZH24_ANACC|nr:non-ribosomal peptide synthetase [Anabaena cylindrica]AFZ57857.1 amino acid adenylation domain protein [Anabaena cylindrica PCC 7122]